jgi:hypothetical protein
MHGPFCPHVYWRRMDICLCFSRYALCQKLSEIRFFLGPAGRTFIRCYKATNRTITITLWDGRGVLSTAGPYICGWNTLTDKRSRRYSLQEDAVRRVQNTLPAHWRPCLPLPARNEPRALSSCSLQIDTNKASNEESCIDQKDRHWRLRIKGEKRFGLASQLILV